MVTGMETRWLYTASPDLKALCEESKGVCIIPVGCVEKHGLHLPLGQDIIQASAIAYKASQLETAAVFADFTFGDVSGGSPNIPEGTVNIPLDLRNKLLLALCEQVSRWGFHKILLCNGHGGNSPWIYQFLRKMSNEKRDFVVASYMISLPAPHKMAEILLEKGSGAIPELTAEDEALLIKYHEQNMFIGHACMGETAHMMGISPESVHLERLGIESGLSNHKTDYLAKEKIQIPRGWDINYANNFAGDDPVGCNERIGKASLRIEAERFAHSIKVYKEDEKIMRWLLDEYQKGW
jgi:creatinine amidohydrolase